MGIIQRGSGKRPHHIDVEYQDRLDNEIQDLSLIHISEPTRPY